MKKILGTAVAVAGMTFGVSIASANPAIDCGCSIILRNGTIVTLKGIDTEEILIRRRERDLEKEIVRDSDKDRDKDREQNRVNARCKVDLERGPRVTFDTNSPATKGFTCDI